MTQKVGMIVGPKWDLFLFSSDIGRLRKEDRFDTEEEALARVKEWGDYDTQEDLEEGREVGAWRIKKILNPQLRGVYSAYAHAYPVDTQTRAERMASSFEENQERSLQRQRASKPILRHEQFATLEEAELAIDKAIDALAMELDPRLVGRIQREQRAQGIHQPFITDLTPFGYEVYRGEGGGSRFVLAPDTTEEEIRAMKFPEAGFLGRSHEEVFTVESGKLRVTDPCYSPTSWCAGTLEEVLNGKWFVHVGRFQEGDEGDYRSKRFETEVEEVFSGEWSEKTQKALGEIAAMPEGEDRDKAQEAMDFVLKMRHEGRLADFSRCWGNPDDWQGGVCYLHIRHESVKGEPIDLSTFVQSDIHVGVDSGQAGFFDLDKWLPIAGSESNASDSREHEAFYQLCCNASLGPGFGAIMNMGANSTTAYGDGGYALYVRRNAEGKAVEARIVYEYIGSEGLPKTAEEEEDEE